MQTARPIQRPQGFFSRQAPQLRYFSQCVEHVNDDGFTVVKIIFYLMKNHLLDDMNVFSILRYNDHPEIVGSAACP
jgi:hypothetical protein